MIAGRVLVALALLLPVSVMAQREYSPNFSIGGKAGATLSRMSFSPEVHQKFTQGLTMGLACRYTEEKIFGLIGEINVTQRGWAEDFAKDEAPEFSYSRTLTYVSIPVMTHIYFGSQKFRGFSISDRRWDFCSAVRSMQISIMTTIKIYLISRKALELMSSWQWL